MKKLSEILTLALELTEKRRERYFHDYGSRQGMCLIVAQLSNDRVIDREERDMAYVFLDGMMDALRKEHGIEFVYLRNYLAFTWVQAGDIESVWTRHYQEIINKLIQEGK